MEGQKRRFPTAAEVHADLELQQELKELLSELIPLGIKYRIGSNGRKFEILESKVR